MTGAESGGSSAALQGVGSVSACVSFDLDGVVLRNPFRDGIFPEVCQALADRFDGDPRRALAAIVEEHRRRIRAKDDPSAPWDPVAPYDWDDIFRSVALACGAPAPERPVAAMVQHYCSRPGYIARMHPTVGPALRWLRERGYRLVAVTNGLWRYQQPVLQALGLEGLFEAVSAPDRTGTAKPEPQAFQAAWAAGPAGTTPVHVGDDLLYDVAAARRAGLVAVWVLPWELGKDEAVQRAEPWERPSLLAQKGLIERELQRLLERRARRDRELAPYALPDGAVLHLGELPRWLLHHLDPCATADVSLDLREVGEALVQWFARAHRELPWRQCPDPYRVLVSEFMLQQTRVQTVVPYFQRFLERFPTLQALAQAHEDEVLEAWRGLGYYRRARYLHRCAQVVMERFGGRIPDDPAQLRRLPGVGPYMAAAVASIAFGRPEPAMDGNAQRVMRRLWLLAGTGGPAATARLAGRLARAMVPAGRAGEFTQALMELGSTVCQARPRCSACPVQPWCAAWARGLQEQVPGPARKGTVPQVAVAAVRLRDGYGRILVVRRPPQGLLGGTWALPATERQGDEPWEQAARRAAEAWGVKVASLRPAGELQHLFSHRRWHVKVFDGEVAQAAEPSPPYPTPGGRDGAAGGDGRWVEPEAASRLLTSRIFQKALQVGNASPTEAPALPRRAAGSGRR